MCCLTSALQRYPQWALINDAINWVNVAVRYRDRVCSHLSAQGGCFVMFLLSLTVLTLCLAISPFVSFPYAAFIIYLRVNFTCVSSGHNILCILRIFTKPITNGMRKEFVMSGEPQRRESGQRCDDRKLNLSYVQNGGRQSYLGRTGPTSMRLM